MLWLSEIAISVATASAAAADLPSWSRLSLVFIGRITETYLSAVDDSGIIHPAAGDLSIR